FAGLVGRVGLAGEQDLHRPLRVAEQLVQARPVSKQEVRPLVRSEATAEADRERVQVELPGRLGSLVGKYEGRSLQLAMDRPRLVRGNFVNGVPAPLG